MTPDRILIACIGNIFLGDDAFGVEVARRLQSVDLPDGVRIVDFGIRGLDLTYALMEGYETVILVDAVPRGGSPGTLYVLELPLEAPPAATGEPLLIEAHNLDPGKVLQLVSSLGTSVPRILLVGCEPGRADERDDFGAELSVPVRAAVDAAVPLLASLVARLLRGEKIEAGAASTIIERKAEPCCD